MMNRNKSSKVSLISLTLLIPMLFGLVVLFSFKMKSTNEPLITIPSKTKVFTKELAGEKPSIFPVSTDEGKVKVSSTYGMRLDPFDKSKKMHHGMDIAAKSGTSVIATAGGEVIEVEVMPKGYGKYIVIKHDDTYSTKYAQLSLQLVKVGAQVSRGQKIGEVGSSGKSTAPHLHYEVIKNGKHVDPVPYISNYSFSQVPAKETKAVVAEQEQLEQAEKQRVLAAQQLTLAEQQRVEANHQLLLAEEARREAEEVRLAMVREEVVLKEQRALLEEQLVKLAAEPVEVKASEPVIVEVEEPVEVEVDPEIEVVSEVPVIQELSTDKDKDKNKSKDKRKNKSKDN